MDTEFDQKPHFWSFDQECFIIIIIIIVIIVIIIIICEWM